MTESDRLNETSRRLSAAEDRLHTALRGIAVLETKIEAAADNLKRQAVEYERRLEMLNHAHTQRMERESTYVRGDLHMKDIAQLRADIADLKDYKSRALGILAFISAVVALTVVWWRGL